jgi:hypothetical protein
MTDEPLFRVIDESEFLAQDSKPTPKKSKSQNTEDRTHKGWYKLNHTQHGFCTVPHHAEVQAQLSEEKQEFRDKYPVRMLYPIGDYLVCKDCYIMGADLDE